MNKTLLALSACAMLGAAANADFLRVEAGVGTWSAEPSGTMNSSGSPVFDVDALGYGSEGQGYAWLLIKQPVPVLPNVRLEYTETSFSGTSESGIVWKGLAYGAGSSSSLELKQYDAIAYYNLLDNTFWTTLDVGIDLKYIESGFEIAGGPGGASDTQSGSGIVPMLYGRVRAELPTTNIGFEGDVKLIGDGDSTLYDARIKADYTFDFPTVDFALELGYRKMSFDADSSQLDIDVATDIEIEGIFFGAALKF